MKYSALLVVLFSTLIFLNCSKKDLPAPNQLNAYNSGIYQQTNTTPVVTSPCASSLVRNKISYTYSPSGTTMRFTPNVSSSGYSNMIQISCADYSTSNNITITIPDKGNFVGTVKYNVTTTAYTNSDAFFSHIFNSYYYYAAYYGYEGDIYAEYTSTEIILSFCGVKVKDSNNDIHEVTGQIVIANNY